MSEAPRPALASRTLAFTYVAAEAKPCAPLIDCLNEAVEAARQHDGLTFTFTHNGMQFSVCAQPDF